MAFNRFFERCNLLESVKGKQVKILYSDKREYTDIIGHIGIVENVADGKKGDYGENAGYGVIIPGHRNLSSAKGIYWFKLNELEFLKEESEENNMGKLTGYKAVATATAMHGGTSSRFAIYEDGTDYKVGDTILTSKGTAHTTESVCVISEIFTPEEYQEQSDSPVLSEVIAKIDTAAYAKRTADRTKAVELRVKMDEAIKKMDEVRKYELYAQNNPELAEMLSSYRTLTKSSGVVIQ